MEQIDPLRCFPDCLAEARFVTHCTNSLIRSTKQQMPILFDMNSAPNQKRL